MSTTVIPFEPTATANFQFQVTLDGGAYTCICTWNLYGQRYYVSVYSPDTTLVLCVPLIGSTDSNNISLVAGYFTSKLVFRISSQSFEVIG